MNYEFPEKLKSLVPYSPGSGDYSIRLDANESFLTPPADIMEKVSAAAMSVPLNRYPDPRSAAVCAAFAGYYGINPDNVVAGNGSDELISVIVNAFTEKGQRAAFLEPDFSMYSFYSHLAELDTVIIRKGDDLEVSADEVIKTVNDNNVSLLLLSNPCNPTSLLLSSEDIERIIRSVGALVVLDEAYMDFADCSLIQRMAEFDNCIMLRTCSKMIGLAAIRLGFAISNDRLTSVLLSAKSPYNVNRVTEAIGTTLLSDRDYVNHCREEIIRSRDLLFDELRSLKLDGFHIYKTSVNFVLIKTDKANEIFEELKKHGILVRCLGGYLRITAGSNDENEKLLSALKDICNTI